MIKLIRRLFIKNYENVGDEKVRTAHGVLAALGGVFMNLLLFGFKLAIGILTFSISIISDALNNLTDLFSCIVNLIGFKVAAKPADKDHPYGHQRIEYIAGMIISFVIIIVGGLLIYNSVICLIEQNKNVSYDMFAFIILGVSIVFKFLLGLFYYGLGKAINSVSLKASMQDSFNDCITTSLVLIAALIQKYVTVVNLWYLDASVSILVSVFIIFSGIKLIKETASPLIGLAPDSQFVLDVIKDITEYKGVLGVHDVMVYNYGPTKIYMTCHVEVDGYIDVFVSHDLIDNIEKKTGKKYGILLTIHMDPVDTKSKDLPILKEHISEVIKSLNLGLTFHDLRAVTGPTHTNVIFDLVLPNDRKIDKNKLTKIFRQELRKVDEHYNVVINFDEKYVK